MSTHWGPLFGLIALGTALAVTGCSDDASTPAAPSAAATDVTAASTAADLNPDFCSALVAFDRLDPPGGEDSEKEYTAAIQRYAQAIESPLATMAANAPDALAAPLETLNSLLPALKQGDIPSYEGPAGSAAIEEVEQAAAAGCGFERVAVTAQDYSFTPDRASLAAGPVSFQLTNDGAEPHVFLLLRKPEGDTREDTAIVGEFLEREFSGDAAQMSEVQDEVVPGGGPFAMPGSTGSHVLDLSAGTYIYWCPIPQGETGDGPPHFALGMIGELTVQ